MYDATRAAIVQRRGEPVPGGRSADEIWAGDPALNRLHDLQAQDEEGNAEANRLIEAIMRTPAGTVMDASVKVNVAIAELEPAAHAYRESYDLIAYDALQDVARLLREALAPAALDERAVFPALCNPAAGSQVVPA